MMTADDAALYDERDDALLAAERAEDRAADAEERAAGAEKLLAAIGEIHQHDGFGACEGCGTTWPCKTRRRLDA